MRQILTVFAFTFKDGIRKKAFILSTIFILAVIAIGCSIPAIMNMFSGDETEVTEEVEAKEETDESAPSKICYYLDEDNLIENGVELLAEALPNWKIVVADKDKEADYRAEIAESENVSLVKITMGEKLPYIAIVNKNFMSGTPVNVISETLSVDYIHSTLLKQGIDEETIEFAQSTLPYGEEYEGTMNLSGYIVGILIVMFTFFAIYYYGYGVAMTVATEKTSRVMETLIVSAKPSRILIGKCLGMGVLGLAQFGLAIVFGAICFTSLVPDGFMLEGMPLTLDGFTVGSSLLIIIFFVLGYTLYAMLNSVCGASVSKIEDLNSAMTPVMVISLVSFYVAYFCMLSASADSMLMKVALYVPFTSSFIMPFKLLNSDVAAMDIIISIACLVATILIVSMVSIKVYSANVLHYGNRRKLKDMLKKN